MASVSVNKDGIVGESGWSYLAHCHLNGMSFQELTFSAKLKDKHYVLSIWSDCIPEYKRDYVFGIEPKRNVKKTDERLIKKLKSVCYDVCVSSRLHSASNTDLDYPYFNDCTEED